MSFNNGWLKVRSTFKKPHSPLSFEGERGRGER